MGADVQLGRDPPRLEASQEPTPASWEVVRPIGDVDVMAAPALLEPPMLEPPMLALLPHLSDLAVPRALSPLKAKRKMFRRHPRCC